MGWVLLCPYFNVNYSIMERPVIIHEDGKVDELMTLDEAWAEIELEDARNSANTVSEGFKDYWYINKNGQRCHTWDYEESIGE